MGESAYFTGTNHFVNLIANNGWYGYDAIKSSQQKCLTTKKDTKSIIQVKAWGARRRASDKSLSTYSADLFGICSVLYELEMLVVMHDASLRN